MVGQLPALFDQLSSGSSANGREALADQLLDLTRRIGNAAYERVDALTTQQRGHDVRQRRATLTAQLSMLALMGVLAMVIVYRVLMPLARLRAAAQAVEGGRLEVRSALRGHDEFAQFSRAFDRMVESLQQRNQMLLASHRRLEGSEAFHARAASIAGLGSWECDFETNEVRWADQTRRIHEVDDDYQPTFESALEFYPIGARQELRTSMDAAIERREGWDLELPFITARAGTAGYVQPARRSTTRTGPSASPAPCKTSPSAVRSTRRCAWPRAKPRPRTPPRAPSWPT